MFFRYKISEFTDFVGKEILLEAQKRGVEACRKNGKRTLPAVETMLLGLGEMLAESGAIKTKADK